MSILYKDKIKNDKIVLLQGENGRKLIEKKLKKDDFNISLIECYKRVLRILDNDAEVKKWRSYKIDTLVVTSSEALHQLKKIISSTNDIKWLLKCKIFVVGQRLYQIAKKLGWKDIVVSNYASNKHFLEMIKKQNL